MLVVAAFAAGVINAIAGGGTLITFPVLLWLGLDPKVANATCTVALVPGLMGGLFGYRRTMDDSAIILMRLGTVSLIGGGCGAWLLIKTPSPTFARLVPFLILFATVLFMIQEPIQRRLKASNPEAHKSSRWLTWAMCFQLLVALYGGYFGAGIGILMLAALSILGLTDIHQMNGLKNFFALCINGVAALYFIWAGMVFWPDVIIMALGAIAGGYGGAGIARRIGRTAVRRIVVGVGFAMAVSLFVKK